MLIGCRNPNCTEKFEMPDIYANIQFDCRKCQKIKKPPLVVTPSRPIFSVDEKTVIGFLKQEEINYHSGLGSLVIVRVKGSEFFTRLKKTLDEALIQGEIKLNLAPIRIIHSLANKGVLARVRQNMSMASYRWGNYRA